MSAKPAHMAWIAGISGLVRSQLVRRKLYLAKMLLHLIKGKPDFLHRI